MKNLILTASEGDRPFKKYSFFSMQEYAKKVNADFIIAEDIEIPKKLNNVKIGRGNNKAYLKKVLWIRKYLEKYDKVLWLDDTCYVNPICPNLFEYVPQGYVAGVPESLLLYPGYAKAFEDFIKKYSIYKNGKETSFNTGIMLYSKECKHIFKDNVLNETTARVTLGTPWPDQALIDYLIVVNNVPRMVLDSKFNRMLICEKYEPYIERYEVIDNREGKLKDISNDFLKKVDVFNKKLLNENPFIYEAFIYHIAGKTKKIREGILKDIHETFSKVKL